MVGRHKDLQLFARPIPISPCLLKLIRHFQSVPGRPTAYGDQRYGFLCELEKRGHSIRLSYRSINCDQIDGHCNQYVRVPDVVDGLSDLTSQLGSAIFSSASSSLIWSGLFAEWALSTFDSSACSRIREPSDSV